MQAHFKVVKTQNTLKISKTKIIFIFLSTTFYYQTSQKRPELTPPKEFKGLSYLTVKALFHGGTQWKAAPPPKSFGYF